MELKNITFPNADLNFIDNVYCIGAMSSYILKGIDNPNIKSKYFNILHNNKN